MPTLQQNQNGRHGVTLIDLLSLFGGVAGCSGAVLAGRNDGWPFTGWAIGLAGGFVCCWGIWKFGRWAIYHLKLHEPKPALLRLILSWIFLFAVVAWVMVSAFIGFRITRLVIHLCQ